MGSESRMEPRLLALLSRVSYMRFGGTEAAIGVAGGGVFVDAFDEATDELGLGWMDGTLDSWSKV